MTHRVVTAALGAAVGVLLVAGCQSSPQAPASPTSSPTATPSQSPAPSDTPSTAPTPEATEPEPLPEAVAPTASGANTLLEPADGATVTGPLVRVTGIGTAFEATLLWRVVVAGTDQVVAEDFTMGGSMGEIGPFEFEVELTPGVYQAEVWAPDMSDGEAGGPERIDLVAVTFVVE